MRSLLVPLMWAGAFALSGCATPQGRTPPAATVTGVIEQFTAFDQSVGGRGTLRTVPVSGVVFAVPGTPLSSASDSAGRFVLTGIPAGYHRLAVTRPGENTGFVPEVHLRAGRTFELTVVVSAPTPPEPSPPPTMERGIHPTLPPVYPMVIVDGVIRIIEGDPTADLVSFDIERMRVLSGVAAVWLYGTRWGASGAVVIETRRNFWR